MLRRGFPIGIAVASGPGTSAIAWKVQSTVISVGPYMLEKRTCG